jgi:hypothetical protein
MPCLLRELGGFESQHPVPEVLQVELRLGVTLAPFSLCGPRFAATTLPFLRDTTKALSRIDNSLSTGIGSA